MEMAMHNVAVGITQVQPITFAVSPEGAVGTYAASHPLPVAVDTVAVLPYVPQVILVDISLCVVCPYARTRPDTPVKQHRRDTDSSLTFKEIVSHLTFIASHESFATE